MPVTNVKRTLARPDNATGEAVVQPPQFSLYRYRDLYLNDRFNDCLLGTPLIFVPGHGGRCVSCYREMCLCSARLCAVGRPSRAIVAQDRCVSTCRPRPGC